MTTYAILHKNDPERCIRFFRQYCKDWHEDNECVIRNFFKGKSNDYLERYPFCRIEEDYDNPRITDLVGCADTFIDFENNPRRRAI